MGSNPDRIVLKSANRRRIRAIFLASSGFGSQRINSWTDLAGSSFGAVSRVELSGCYTSVSFVADDLDFGNWNLVCLQPISVMVFRLYLALEPELLA
jgi:hypothetical protein